MGFFRRDKEPYAWYWGKPSWEPSGIELLRMYMSLKIYEQPAWYAAQWWCTSFIDYSKWKWVKKWTNAHNRYKETT